MLAASLSLLAVSAPLLASALTLPDMSTVPSTFASLMGCPSSLEYRCKNRTNNANTCCSPTPGEFGFGVERARSPTRDVDDLRSSRCACSRHPVLVSYPSSLSLAERSVVNRMPQCLLQGEKNEVLWAHEVRDWHLSLAVPSSLLTAPPSPLLHSTSSTRLPFPPVTRPATPFVPLLISSTPLLTSPLPSPNKVLDSRN
jgi:hypothetical protein